MGSSSRIIIMEGAFFDRSFLFRQLSQWSCRVDPSRSRSTKVFLSPTRRYHNPRRDSLSKLSKRHRVILGGRGWRGDGYVVIRRKQVGGSLAFRCSLVKTPHPPFGHPLPAAAGRGDEIREPNRGERSRASSPTFTAPKARLGLTELAEVRPSWNASGSPGRLALPGLWKGACERS
jgi:hypothetical protein